MVGFCACGCCSCLQIASSCSIREIFKIGLQGWFLLAPPGRGLEKAFAGELVSFGAVLRLLLQEQRLLPSWAGGRTPRAPTATTTTAATHQVSFLPSWLTSAGVIACGADCCCALHGCRGCSAPRRQMKRLHEDPHRGQRIAVDSGLG